MSLLSSIFSKERPANDPGIIENLRKKTHDKITNLIGPFAQMRDWITGKLEWILGKQKTSTAVDQVPEPVPATEPEAISSPIAEAEQKHRNVLDQVLKSFETATKSPEILALRHADGKGTSPERKPELDALAHSRFQGMKSDGEKWLEEEVKKMTEQKKSPEEIEQFRREREGGYLLKHDDEWLKNHHCAENILNGFYSSGREIAQAFLGSDKHRQNILGSYKEMGLAIESLKDVKTGKQMYFVVCLYKNGVQHPEAIPPLAQAASIPDDSRGNLSSAYLEAIESELTSSGLEVTVQKDEDLSNKLITDENEIHRGTFVAKLSHQGKDVRYVVYQVPPTFARLSDEGQEIMELLPQEVAGDFKKALGVEGVPSAGELQQSFDSPSAAQGVPEAERMKEDSEVIGLS